MTTLGYLIIILAAYVAGSINFSIILFWFLKKGDPRAKFSGNAGTFNVYRQAGAAWAAVVLILDMGRSIAVAIIAKLYVPMELVPWAGFFLVLGTHYPLFHNFRGGKGVANYLGFSAAIVPVFTGISALVWVAVYKITPVTFIASYCMIAILAVGTILRIPPTPISVIGTIATVALIMIAHRKNVLEYLAGKTIR